MSISETPRSVGRGTNLLVLIASLAAFTAAAFVIDSTVPDLDPASEYVYEVASLLIGIAMLPLMAGRFHTIGWSRAWLYLPATLGFPGMFLAGLIAIFFPADQTNRQALDPTFKAAWETLKGNLFTHLGRISRARYWMALTFLGLTTAMIQNLVQIMPLLGIPFFFLLLGMIPAMIFLAIRRLHDTDRSGHFLWIVLLPILGGLYVIYLLLIKGDPWQNRFGPAPAENAAGRPKSPETGDGEDDAEKEDGEINSAA